MRITSQSVDRETHTTEGPRGKEFKGKKRNTYRFEKDQEGLSSCQERRREYRRWERIRKKKIAECPDKKRLGSMGGKRLWAGGRRWSRGEMQGQEFADIDQKITKKILRKKKEGRGRGGVK